jgi:hypothetical protein
MATDKISTDGEVNQKTFDLSAKARHVANLLEELPFNVVLSFYDGKTESSAREMQIWTVGQEIALELAFVVEWLHRRQKPEIAKQIGTIAVDAVAEAADLAEEGIPEYIGGRVLHVGGDVSLAAKQLEDLKIRMRNLAIHLRGWADDIEVEEAQRQVVLKSAKAAIDAEEARHQMIMKASISANAAPQQMAQVDGGRGIESASMPPVAKRESGEETSDVFLTPGQPAIISGDKRETVLRELEPAIRKAYIAYQYAETMNGRELEDRKAYDWLHENGIDHRENGLGELMDYELPTSFETFKRYLTGARKTLGENKYTRRSGREHGGSVVTKNQIE